MGIVCVAQHHGGMSSKSVNHGAGLTYGCRDWPTWRSGRDFGCPREGFKSIRKQPRSGRQSVPAAQASGCLPHVEAFHRHTVRPTGRDLPCYTATGAGASNNRAGLPMGTSHPILHA